MDVKTCTDENAPRGFTKVQTTQRNNGPPKSPLKPVNDEERLTKTPQCPDEVIKTPVSSPYTCIRQLDSAERWIERTSVVTKQDHLDNLKHAGIILENLVDSLPICDYPNKWIHEALTDVNKSQESDLGSEKSPSGKFPDLDELANLLGDLDIAQKGSDKDELEKEHVALQKSENFPKQVKQLSRATDSGGDICCHASDRRQFAICDKADSKGKKDLCNIDQLQPHDAAVAKCPTSVHTCGAQDSASNHTADDTCSPKIQLEKPPLEHNDMLKNGEKFDDSTLDPFKPKTQLQNSPALALSSSSANDTAKAVSAVGRNNQDIMEKGKNLCNEQPEGPINNASSGTDTSRVVPDMRESQLRSSNSLQDSCHKESTGMDQTGTVIPEAQTMDSAQDTIYSTDQPKLVKEGPLLSKPQEASEPHSQGDALCLANSQSTKSEKKLNLSPSMEKNEDLDSTVQDPFKPKSQLVNSPVSTADGNTALSNPGIESEADPFKPQSQLMNSPVKIVKQNVPKAQNKPIPADEIDLSRTKSQVVNSPIQDKTDPFKPKSQLANSPAQNVNVPLSDQQEADPFKSKSQLANSPAQNASIHDSDLAIKDVEPFKPKSQLANSPVQNVSVPHSDPVEDDPFKPKSQLANSLAQNASIHDSDLAIKDVEPFKPKSQLANSPVQNVSVPHSDPVEGDPFKSKSQLANSPTQNASIHDSDLAIKDVEPFKPKSQLANSPVQNVSVPPSDPVEGDPFKSKSQLANSPTQNASIHDSDLAIKDVEPFKPKSQLANSPVQNVSVPHSDPVEGDPFKSKSQLANSPAQNASIHDSDLACKDVDPFKSKSQLANSSVQNVSMPHSDPAGADPVKPKSQLANSSKQNAIIQPSTSAYEDVDPFKPKSQLGNSPVQDSSKADPFKPKSQLANSPAMDLNSCLSDPACKDKADPFKPTSQLADSSLQNVQHSGPACTDVVSLFKPKIQLVSPSAQQVASLSSEEIADPDHTKSLETRVDNGTCSQEPVSPKVNVDGITKVENQASTDKSKSENVMCADGGHASIVPSDGGDTVTQEDPHTSVSPDQEQDDGFTDKEEFLPATQVFNDPAFFDMLEKSNSTWGSNPKRGSVLLKFDPLQERRESNFLKQGSPVLMNRSTRMSDMFRDSRNLGASDDSVCLFGTPPRVARRRTLTRKVHKTNVASIEEETAANEVDMILGLDEEGDAMDTILHNNLVAPSSKGVKLVDIGEHPQYTESEVKEMRAQLSMHYQELMLKKDKEFQEKLNEQRAKLEAERDGLENKNKTLQKKLKGLSELIGEYEALISQITAEKQQATEEKEILSKELQELKTYNTQVVEDNKTFEKSFDDLFHRYEKVKTKLESAVENEKCLKQALEDAQEKLVSSKETNKKVKELAEAKLAEQEEKYEKLSTSTQDEIRRLEALVKRKDLQIDGLEASLEQKKKENKELTDLCDSLIEKVKPS